MGLVESDQSVEMTIQSFYEVIISAPSLRAFLIFFGIDISRYNVHQTHNNIDIDDIGTSYFYSLRQLKTSKLEIALPGHDKGLTYVEKDIFVALNRLMHKFIEAEESYRLVLDRKRSKL